ncbi:MAG: hypothetical protein EYX74_01540 [Desulfobulbaceae bacterium]|nr:MAG: hypothetical protein EYX74_01540 [Desulfobulbaceae bacterium]
MLGDDRFSEEALHNAEEVFNQAVDLHQIIKAVGRAYGVKGKELAEAGKARPASEVRAVAALLIQDCDILTLTALGQHLGRELSSLSQAANRIRQRLKKDSGLRKNSRYPKKHSPTVKYPNVKPDSLPLWPAPAL